MTVPMGLENADWTKSTWDLYLGPELVTQLDELMWVFAINGKPKREQQKRLRLFVATPAAEQMPATLRRQVMSFLRS